MIIVDYCAGNISEARGKMLIGKEVKCGPSLQTRSAFYPQLRVADHSIDGAKN